MAEKTFKIIRLENLSPLHIGTGTENYYVSSAYLHSDTIVSALTSVGIQTGKLQEKDIKNFINSFKISSAFPYIANTYYFPIPNGKKVLSSPDYWDKHRKELKKLIFVNGDSFRNYVEGKPIKIKDIEKCKPFDGSKQYVSQRVSVNEEENQAIPFFFEWNFYDDNCGLYFIFDCEDNVLNNKVKPLFDILGEFGLGSDRNIGGGKFTVCVKDIQLPEVTDFDQTMLLSSYIPTDTELKQLDLGNSNYTLIQRGGYVAGSETETFRHLRKNTIYMFASGSVFNTTADINGTIVDLKPDFPKMHSVYRSGRALTFKIKSQQI